MINLEVPKKFEQLVDQAHMVAIEIFRKNSRKYDLAEHEYPKELDMLAAVIEGSNPAGAGAGAVGSAATATVSKPKSGGRQPQRLEHGDPARADASCAGATSGCC